ncbi:MAG: hypothetical protein Q9227_002516 [Pyrenula ochraceoflavens]
MAPASVKRDSAAGRDLLWAYQLRKEHNDLLYRLDEVEKVANDAAAGQTQSTKETRSAIDTVAKQAQQEAANARERIVELQRRLDAQEAHYSHQSAAVTDLKKVFEHRVEALESRVFDLSDRNTNLEQQLQRALEILRQFESSESPKKRTGFNCAQLDDTASENEEVMESSSEEPTPKHKRHKVAKRPSSEVLMASAAEPNTLPEESLSMLPDYTTQNLVQACLLELHQATYTSLKQYIDQGTETLNKLPRRKEGQVVDNFVAGMREAKDRKHFERALDKAGWTWENVLKIFEDISRQTAQTDGRKAVSTISGKALQDHIAEEDIETVLSADSPPSPKLPKHHNNRKPQRGANRRSQRIKQKQSIKQEESALQLVKRGQIPIVTGDVEFAAGPLSPDCPPWWINGRPPR